MSAHVSRISYRQPKKETLAEREHVLQQRPGEFTEVFIRHSQCAGNNYYVLLYRCIVCRPSAARALLPIIFKIADFAAKKDPKERSKDPAKIPHKDPDKGASNSIIRADANSTNLHARLSETSAYRTVASGQASVIGPPCNNLVILPSFWASQRLFWAFDLNPPTPLSSESQRPRPF
jgi:hypothetical protein